MVVENSPVLRDFEEIPCPPALPLLGNMLDLIKHGSRLDKYNNELQAKYGDIVRMYSPGVFGHMVMLYKPKDIKNLFSQEERIPFAPGKRYGPVRKILYSVCLVRVQCDGVHQRTSYERQV